MCCCPISKLFQSFWEVSQAKHLLLLFLVYYSVWTCNKHWCEGIVFWWWVQLVMLWNKPLSNPLSPPWSAMAHLTGFLLFKLPIRQYTNLGRVSQQPPMHQLAVLSTGWAAFFHSVSDGVHHNPFLFAADHYTFLFLLVRGGFSLGPDLTPSYLVHFPTLVSTAPTLVPYLLSPTNIATLITSHPIDLVMIVTTYLTNLATLLITYLTNLTIVLNTYPIDLTTLHTQPPYWHKYFTNLVPLLRQLVSYVLTYLSN